MISNLRYQSTNEQGQGQGQVKSSENDKLLITFPLAYTYFIKPDSNVHESIIQSDWRIANSNANSENPFFKQLPQNSLIFDNLSYLRKIVNQVNESYATFGIITILNEFRLSDLMITISIIGNYNLQKEMNDIRLTILQSFSQIIHSIISVDQLNEKYCFDQNGFIKKDLIDFIKSISMFNKCSIYITKIDNSSKFEISIIGHKDQVKVTENKLRLFIDDINPQIFSDFLQLDSLSLLPLVGGTELSNLKKIVKQTNCNIYLPNLLPEMFYNNSLEKEIGPIKIFITGLRSFVLLAKTMLSEIISKIGKTPFIKQVSVMPIKREILMLTQVCDKKNNTNNSRSNNNPNSNYNLTNLNDNFDNLMFNTACYISLPSLGYENVTGNGDIINFQGNSIEETEIAIDIFMEKISSLYCAKCEFICPKQDSEIDINKLLNFSDSLSFSSNCFVSTAKVDNKYIFQILGKSENIRLATNCLTQFSNYIQEPFSDSSVQYQIELPNKEKDFIAGKKNGKIIKIINMSSASIKLLPFTDHNFIVEINCNDLMDSVLGLGLFEDELPTMYTFNVPESFHRQIIGVGGQTIQTIMRKFNVFIKFSNSFELSDKSLDFQHSFQSANFQQSFIRKNNVVIKCPAKNKSQIPLAKLELEKLVERVSKNSYSCSIVKLTNQQWKLLTSSQFNLLYNLNRKKPTNFITELEKYTNTFIKFPKLDSVENSEGFINLEIYGIDNNSKICYAELQKIIPYVYEFKISKTNGFNEIEKISRITRKNLIQIGDLAPIQLDYINSLVVPMKILYNVELELKQGQQYDSICVNYYPSSFGFPMNVINPERLNNQLQLQIIQSDGFCQIISALNQFLSDWSFGIIVSEISNSDLVIQDKEYHTRQEKENVNRLKLTNFTPIVTQSFNKNSESNIINNHNSNNNNNNIIPLNVNNSFMSNYNNNQNFMKSFPTGFNNLVSQSPQSLMAAQQANLPELQLNSYQFSNLKGLAQFPQRQFPQSRLLNVNNFDHQEGVGNGLWQ